MQLVIPRETQPGENRVSATPETVKKLVRLGAEVVIESGAGTGAGISDADYEAAGASIGSDRKSTSELSHITISYAVFCMKKKK